MLGVMWSKLQAGARVRDKPTLSQGLLHSCIASQAVKKVFVRICEREKVQEENRDMMLKFDQESSPLKAAYV
jgi:hypothetical protein